MSIWRAAQANGRRQPAGGPTRWRLSPTSRVTPASRLALLSGRVLRDAVVLIVFAFYFVVYLPRGAVQ